MLNFFPILTKLICKLLYIKFHPTLIQSLYKKPANINGNILDLLLCNVTSVLQL